MKHVFGKKERAKCCHECDCQVPNNGVENCNAFNVRDDIRGNRNDDERGEVNAVRFRNCNSDREKASGFPALLIFRRIGYFVR